MDPSRWRIGLGIGALAATFVLGLRGLGVLTPLELALYESYLRRLPVDENAQSPVAVVTITDGDLRAAGQSVIPDAVLANALERLLEHDPRVIGIDLFRDLPVPPGSQHLATLLQSDSRIFGVRSATVPPPPALEGSQRYGFAGFLPDRDGRIRRALLYKGAGEFSFATRLALAYLAAEEIAPGIDPDNGHLVRIGATTVPKLDASAGGYVRTDAGGYQFLLDFRRAREGFDTFELTEVLSGRVDPDRIRHRMVIIGTVAEGAYDIFDVPIDRGAADSGIPGAELHGHVADQLVRYGRGQSPPLGVSNNAQEIGFILLCSFLGVAVATRPTRWVAAILAVGLTALWVLGDLAMRSGWWLPVGGPGLAWVSSAGLATAWSSTRERRDRALLMQLFSRHVSPEVAEEVWTHRQDFLEGGRPKAQRLEATVLFLDIRGSTSITERLDPETRMDWTNRFMEAMAATISEHGGFVDDYFGDGIKANFGVPFPRKTRAQVVADALAAGRCAIALRDTLHRVNEQFIADALPSVAMRIGIHSGPVIAGSLGSRNRLKYTTVGEACVIAQRVESLESVEHDFEQSPCRILVTDSTATLLGGQFETESLGKVLLKGKQDPVEIYRVSDLVGPEAARPNRGGTKP